MLRHGFHLAHELNPDGGTLLEFGVGWGESYLWQAEQIITKFCSDRLIGFDSFQGLPAEAAGVWRPDRHAEGNFAFPKDQTLAVLRQLGAADNPRFSFVEGFYADTLTATARGGIENVIFVNIDVDLYISTLQVLDFIKPLLQPNTIIYWDDWKDPADTYSGEWGEHMAWREWSSRNPDVRCETVAVNSCNQRCMRVMELL